MVARVIIMAMVIVVVITDYGNIEAVVVFVFYGVGEEEGNEVREMLMAVIILIFPMLIMMWL